MDVQFTCVEGFLETRVQLSGRFFLFTETRPSHRRANERKVNAHERDLAHQNALAVKISSLSTAPNRISQKVHGYGTVTKSTCLLLLSKMAACYLRLTPVEVRLSDRELQLMLLMELLFTVFAEALFRLQMEPFESPTEAPLCILVE